MAAPKGNNFNPKGRPQKVINWELFEQLCHIQCTQQEICNILHVNHETLTSRVKGNYGEEYSHVYKKYSDAGKGSLRRTQFALAKKNAAMAIWLGKQYLGQKDHDKEEKLPPNDSQLELIQDLLQQNKELKEQLNASKSKADPILSGSN